MAEKGKIVVDGKFVILLIALVILATAGSALLTSRLLAQPAEGGVTSEKPPEFGPRVEFDTIVVNLRSNSTRTNQYIRVKMTIEFYNDDILKDFDNYRTILQDKVIEMLRNKTSDDLTGGDGQIQLRQEIRKAFNEILPKDPVMSIYFTEFLIS